MSEDEVRVLDALLGVLRAHDVMVFTTTLEGSRTIQVQLAPRPAALSDEISVVGAPGGWKSGD